MTWQLLTAPSATAAGIALTLRHLFRPEWHAGAEPDTFTDGVLWYQVLAIIQDADRLAAGGAE